LIFSDCFIHRIYIYVEYEICSEPDCFLAWPQLRYQKIKEIGSSVELENLRSPVTEKWGTVQKCKLLFFLLLHPAEKSLRWELSKRDSEYFSAPIPFRISEKQQAAHQGCQIVYLRTKNTNFVTFWNIKFWYILWTFGILCDHLLYFMASGYFCGFWYIFPVLECCIKKNLATLHPILVPRQQFNNVHTYNLYTAQSLNG
jgi:hypothetical protein